MKIPNKNTDEKISGGQDEGHHARTRDAGRHAGRDAGREAGR